MEYSEGYAEAGYLEADGQVGGSIRLPLEFGEDGGKNDGGRGDISVLSFF